MLSNDLFDFQLSVLMAITIELAVALAALLVEHEHLVALDELFQNFANYFCALHTGSTYGYRAVVIDEQHFLKFNSLAYFCFVQTVYEEALACFCLELLTVNLYDCVHFNYVLNGFFREAGRLCVVLLFSPFGL